MEVLKFVLKGRNAFFKIPEVNTYYYFTYGNIHKVALLGIFGAVLGYDGYGQQKSEDDYPEFYRKLRNLSVSIVPQKNSKGYIAKRIQSFNNSVGYASQEQGGNLIVKEQWLEQPEWEIYVKLDCEGAVALKDALIQKKCIYMPYLGSNDHPADITEVEVLEGHECLEQEIEVLDSLFPAQNIQMDEEDDDIVLFLYQEYLPVGMTKETNQYCLEKMIFTNRPIKGHACPVYQVREKNIVFY